MKKVSSRAGTPDAVRLPGGKLVVYKWLEVINGRAIPNYSTTPPPRASYDIVRPEPSRTAPARRHASCSWLRRLSPRRRGSIRADAIATPMLPPSLARMVETERAFAARALMVGWKQAFLEYFADDAVGFDGGRGGAWRKQQFASQPGPAEGPAVVWEPRYGDIAGSGELGYLTGPVRSILPSRNNGQPRHSAYFSIWKRQRDGSYKVVMDVGTPTPRAGPLRARLHARPARATGSPATTTSARRRSAPPTACMNSALRSEPGQRLSRPPGARSPASPAGRHAAGRRHAHPGVAGHAAALCRPPTAVTRRRRGPATSATRGAPTSSPARGTAPREEGFYVRVWMRETNGQWQDCGGYHRSHSRHRPSCVLKYRGLQTAPVTVSGVVGADDAPGTTRRGHSGQAYEVRPEGEPAEHQAAGSTTGRCGRRCARRSRRSARRSTTRTSTGPRPLSKTVSIVDKMATKGIIHRNTAGRYKSRLAARVHARRPA